MDFGAAREGVAFRAAVAAGDALLDGAGIGGLDIAFIALARRATIGVDIAARLAGGFRRPAGHSTLRLRA